MDKFEQARHNMVESQLRPADITDRRILAAMADLPRELFVPPSSRAAAYADQAVALNEPGDSRPARHLMEPRVFAKILQLAAIRPGELVLDVGCATGYSAAVLARLTDAVVAVEEDEELAARANDLFTQVDAGSVALVSAPLRDGYPAEGPYDVIVLNGAVEQVPEALFAQLQDGGRLVCVVRAGATGQAYLYVKHGGVASGRPAFDAQVPLLPGFARAKEFVF